MAVERTLSIIKPDATKRNLTGKINAKFEEAGLRIAAQVQIQALPAAVIQQQQGAPVRRHTRTGGGVPYYLLQFAACQQAAAFEQGMRGFQGIVHALAQI